MNLEPSQEESAFRAEVREFLASRIEPRMRSGAKFEDRLEADRVLADGGYLGYTWPTEFGGAGGSPLFAAILDEERGAAGIPASTSPSRFGINLLGPALMAHATRPQLERFLPPILRAETVWCQGFSEPEAGSDLANVQTTAVQRGDSLVVNGSKIWTTQGPEADWCFALVRTGAREARHRNLTFVLIDMNQPGVEIRPLVQVTGTTDFSQVFFDDAEVPVDQVIGEIDGGWKVAMTLLGAERAFAQLSRFGQYRNQLDRVVGLVRAHGIDDAHILEDLGTVAADLTGIRNLSLKIASLATAGEDIGALSSVTKLWWSTTHQKLVDLGYEVATTVREDVDYWFPLWLESRAETIYAGASQIQKNIISERLLGLPR